MISIERIKLFLQEDPWSWEPSQLSRSRKFFYQQLKFLLVVIHEFRRDQVRLQALALSFKLILSVVPLLAVAFSLLKAFGVQNRLRPFLGEVLAPLGPDKEAIIDQLLTFVNNMNVGALGSIGLIALFLTVVALVGNIESAFNEIWGSRQPRNLARKFSDYLSALLVGPVLIAAALAITASLQSHTLLTKLAAVEPFGTLVLVGLRLIPYITVWLAFSFLYIFVPNTRVKLSSALLGALVAALLWETAGWGFAAFVASAAKYYAVYSSFAILLLFLVWIYLSWLIILLGAEVAFAHQHFEIYQREREPNVVSNAEREKLALHIMALIGQSFHCQKPGWKLESLAKHLQVPCRVIDEILEMLKTRSLVVEAGEDGTLFPARDLEQIAVKEIIDAIRHHGEREGEPPAGAQENHPLRNLLGEIDESMNSLLQNRTLKSLILSLSDEGVPKGQLGTKEECRHDA